MKNKRAITDSVIVVAGERGVGMTYQGLRLAELKFKRCSWMCPRCGAQCAGIAGHSGEHQCPIHYRPKPVKV